MLDSTSPNVVLISARKVNMIKSFLKWAGGKSQSIGFLHYHMCERTSLNGITDVVNGRFIEPFVGSGVVFMNIFAKSYIINDINTDLVQLYRTLQTKGSEFILACEELFVPENNTQEKYIEFRDEFNSTDIKDMRRSLLFIYLNRHCFNGLCRYNKSGGFNVPFGKYDVVGFPKENLIKAIKKLNNVTILNSTFEEVLKMATTGDTVYCDPPYVPISETAAFTDYAQPGFELKDQQVLAKLAEESKASVFISNHDTDVTRELYKNATEIVATEVIRSISADKDSRKPVKELLAIYKNK